MTRSAISILCCFVSAVFIQTGSLLLSLPPLGLSTLAMGLQLTFLSDKQAPKALDAVLRQVKPCHWTDIKPATAARIEAHMEAALGAEDPSSLLGSELRFSEDGFSWYKFLLVEACQDARVLRYEGKTSKKHMLVKPVANVVVKFTVEYEGKPKGPQLHAWSLGSGGHLGSYNFQWGDLACQVFTAASQKMSHFKRMLSEPEQKAICWMLGDDRIYPTSVHMSMWSWLKSLNWSIPARSEVSKDKKPKGPLKTSAKKRVVKNNLK